MAPNLKRRTPGGPYYFRARINGRRIWRSTGFHDLERARRRAREIEAAIRAGDLGWERPAPTVREWWETYRRSYSIRKAFPHRDAQLVARFLAAYGSTRIDAIRRSDCERWINTERISDRYRRPLKKSTRRLEAAFLKAFFQRAVDDGLLKANPWKGVKLPAAPPRERVMSYEEEAALRAFLNPEYNRLLTVLLGTGLRSAELLGLRPSHVGPDALWVVGKGGKARRIPLRDDVREALDAQQRGNGPYWTQRPNTLRDMLKCACRRAGITPHITIHDLRRTFASRCAAAGMRPKTLQEILGHQSIEVTMRYYVQVDDATKAAELRAVGTVVPMPQRRRA